MKIRMKRKIWASERLSNIFWIEIETIRWPRWLKKSTMLPSIPQMVGKITVSMKTTDDQMIFINFWPGSWFQNKICLGFFDRFYCVDRARSRAEVKLVQLAIAKRNHQTTQWFYLGKSEYGKCSTLYYSAAPYDKDAVKRRTWETK